MVRAWVNISTDEIINFDRLQYWQATWIWISKPQTIDKRLFGQHLLEVFQCPVHFADDVWRKLVSIKKNTLNDSAINIFNFVSTETELNPCSLNDSQVISDSCYFIVRRLLLKNKSLTNLIEILFLNYFTNEVFRHLVQDESEFMQPSLLPFILQWNNGKICARAEDSVEISFKWLKFHFLPKIMKWANNASFECAYREKQPNSLQLINTNEYNELYIQWKEKYGKKIIEGWTESTDPVKFVYEDIAIAAYLHLLWNKCPVKFVDLGCGNGLLVFILTEEGHQGKGIDIRPRKIWSTYPSNIVLEIGTVTPDRNCFFPDVDWIIGNHSDELTPWIPIFAARSSSSCNFFLLPCCAFELNGKKFQRRNASLSTYQDHMKFLEGICSDLDFNIAMDKLRIPSTKRSCIVGFRTTVPDKREIDCKVQKMLSKFDLHDQKIRKATEEVRNCTQIDRSTTEKICNIISQELIKKQQSQENLGNSIWSDTCSLSFPEAVSVIQKLELKKLKNEFGGLKTVLKNNHFIFKVQHGRICFRKPIKKENSKNWKRNLCWFFHNHPSKCPLLDNECSYIH